QSLLSTNVNINTDNGLNPNGQPAVIGNIAGTGNLNLGGANINIGHLNTSQTYSGQLSATTGGIDKRGTGTWTLTAAGSSMSRFGVSSGQAVLIGGSLTLNSTSGNNRALTVGGLGSAGTGSLTVQSGAVLNTFATGAGSALIKSSSSTPATLTVTGASSRWDAAKIDIGIDSNNVGAVVVENGGVI